MSDNPLLNRPPNADMEKPFSILWEEFEIELGMLLLLIWRKFCTGLGRRKPECVTPSEQSNTAVIALMQSVEKEIERPAILRIDPTIERFGYSAQEVADGLRMIASARSKIIDINEREEQLDQKFAYSYELTVEDARYRRSHNLSMLPQALSLTLVNSDGFEFPSADGRRE